MFACSLIITLAQHRQPTVARFQLKRRGGGGCARPGNHPSRVGGRSTLITGQAVTTRLITDRHPSDCRRLALVDTVGYSHLKEFDTPGCRRSSRSYSQQYESPPTVTRSCRRPAPIESPPIAISIFEEEPPASRSEWNERVGRRGTRHGLLVSLPAGFRPV